MELNETTEFMNSADYRERFVGEYCQAKIRYDKLKKFVDTIEASQMAKNIIEPNHDCPLGLLKHQQDVMGEYLHILEVRSIIEGINLTTSINLEIKKK